MTEDTSTVPAGPATHSAVTAAGGARPDRAPVAGRYLSWIPTWGLIATKHLELRKRRGLMVVAVLLTGGKPCIGPAAAGVAGNVYKNLATENFFTAKATITPAAFLSRTEAPHPASGY